MKRLSKCIIALLLIVFCTACSSEEKYTSSSYDDGYLDGYDIGYSEGFDDCKEELSNDVDLAFSKMTDNATKYGWHPEEALCVLEDYEKGKATKEDFLSAIDTLSAYYYGTLDCLDETLDIDVY